MTKFQIKIKQLISEHRPNGVEFKELGEIAVIVIGEFVHKDKQDSNAQYPVYNGGTSQTGYYANWNQSENKILISARGANAGYVNKIENKFWLGNSCYSIDIKNPRELNWTFVYYYLKNKQNDLIGDQQKGGIPAVSKSQVEKFRIPLPPLPIQEEIVKILDSFTELEAELEAELELRKMQYEWYTEKLFKLDSSVSSVSLGETGTFTRGNGLQKKDFTESGVGCIHYGQIYTFYGTFTDKTKSFVSPDLAKKLKKVQKGDVIITNTSENLEDVGKAVVWCGEYEIVTGGHATIFKPKMITGKYFAYYTQTKMFFDQKRKFAKGTKVIDVSATDLSKITIPVPSFAVQNRIVSILDKFNALVNDISLGLPAELNARRQQYEYYRNKLLTFKEYAE